MGALLLLLLPEMFFPQFSAWLATRFTSSRKPSLTLPSPSKWSEPLLRTMNIYTVAHSKSMVYQLGVFLPIRLSALPGLGTGSSVALSRVLSRVPGPHRSCLFCACLQSTSNKRQNRICPGEAIPTRRNCNSSFLLLSGKISLAQGTAREGRCHLTGCLILCYRVRSNLLLKEPVELRRNI